MSTGGFKLSQTDYCYSAPVWTPPGSTDSTPRHISTQQSVIPPIHRRLSSISLGPFAENIPIGPHPTHYIVHIPVPVSPSCPVHTSPDPSRLTAPFSEGFDAEYVAATTPRRTPREYQTPVRETSRSLRSTTSSSSNTPPINPATQHNFHLQQPRLYVPHSLQERTPCPRMLRPVLRRENTDEPIPNSQIVDVEGRATSSLPISSCRSNEEFRRARSKEQKRRTRRLLRWGMTGLFLASFIVVIALGSAGVLG